MYKRHILFGYEFLAFTSFRRHVYYKLFNNLPNTTNFLRVTIAEVSKKSLIFLEKQIKLINK